MQDTATVHIRKNRVTRYIVVVLYDDLAMSIPVDTDWTDWEEDLYVTNRLSVQQVMCPLGRGYVYGTQKEYR